MKICIVFIVLLGIAALSKGQSGEQGGGQGSRPEGQGGGRPGGGQDGDRPEAGGHGSGRPGGEGHHGDENSTVEDRRHCRANQVWRNCGTPCRNDCRYLFRQCPVFNCASGCFCARGYRRNRSGLCVPQFQCRDRD